MGYKLKVYQLNEFYVCEVVDTLNLIVWISRHKAQSEAFKTGKIVLRNLREKHYQ